jgi:RHS repeat-associated protein
VIDPNLSVLAYGSARAFAGREFVDELVLAYHRRRWYDVATERFISEDPAAADVNLYRYAENDPVNFVDTSGLSIKKPTSFLPAFNPILLNTGNPLSSASTITPAGTFGVLGPRAGAGLSPSANDIQQIISGGPRIAWGQSAVRR